MNLYTEALVIKAYRLHLAAKVSGIVLIVTVVLVAIAAGLWTTALILLNGQPNTGALYVIAATTITVGLISATTAILTILARQAQEQARYLLAGRHDIEALRKATSW